MFVLCINRGLIVKLEYVYYGCIGFLDNFDFFCPTISLFFNFGKIKTFSKIKIFSPDMSKRMFYPYC